MMCRFDVAQYSTWFPALAFRASFIHEKSAGLLETGAPTFGLTTSTLLIAPRLAPSGCRLGARRCSRWSRNWSGRAARIGARGLTGARGWCAADAGACGSQELRQASEVVPSGPAYKEQRRKAPQIAPQ